MGMIESGSGERFSAIVNSKGQLLSRGVIVTSAVEATTFGDSYNLNTKTIQLTNAVETPVFYLKNNEDKNMFIEAVVIGLGPTTLGAATEIPVTFVRNPTAGTIVTDKIAADISSNRNYGSSGSLTADVFKGATGKTMTGGEDHIFVYGFAKQRIFVAINELLPTGSTFGVKIDPPALNDDLNIYIAVICYLEK